MLGLYLSPDRDFIPSIPVISRLNMLLVSTILNELNWIKINTSISGFSLFINKPHFTQPKLSTQLSLDPGITVNWLLDANGNCGVINVSWCYFNHLLSIIMGKKHVLSCALIALNYALNYAVLTLCDPLWVSFSDCLYIIISLECRAAYIAS